MSIRNLVTGVVLGTAIAAGLGAALLLRDAPATPVAATLVPPGDALPDFVLLDHEGRRADRSIFEGEWDLVFFGFTHCPDICPTTLHLLAGARESLDRSGQQPLPRIVLVSVDPERDTPEVLARYTAAFGDDIIGLTGDITEIEKLTQALGIYFAKTEPTEDGSYSVDHSTVVLVVNPEGRFRALFSGQHRVEHFVHDVPLIISTR